MVQDADAQGIRTPMINEHLFFSPLQGNLTSRHVNAQTYLAGQSDVKARKWPDLSYLFPPQHQARGLATYFFPWLFPWFYVLCSVEQKGSMSTTSRHRGMGHNKSISFQSNPCQGESGQGSEQTVTPP